MEQWERELLVSIDKKVDKILEQIPHFVTWGKLGAFVATLVGLTFAAFNLG